MWPFLGNGTGSTVEAIEQAIVRYLEQILQAIGWPGVVVVMALENANVPIPSEVPMPLAGWMLVQARGLSVWHAVLFGGLFGGLGSTIGSLISYALGFYGGRPLLKRYGRYLFVTERELEMAEAWFTRWRDWAILISRVLPLARTFISYPAGVFKVPVWRFTALTFLGSVPWCSLLAAGGYWFGARWELIRAYMRPFDLPIAILLIGGSAYYVYRHLRRTRVSTLSEPSLE